MSDDLVVQRIAKLERRQSYLIVGSAILLLGLVATAAWASQNTPISEAVGAAEFPQELTLRRLAIVDANGVERVVLGAPLPPPRLHGKTTSRGSDVGISGMLIFDATGTERGGYVTDDGYGNAFFTLDGRGEQTVLMLAEPSGATMFKIWNRDKEGAVTSSVTMGAFGNPFLNLKQDGELVFSAPEDNPQATNPKPLFR